MSSSHPTNPTNPINSKSSSVQFEKVVAGFNDNDRTALGSVSQLMVSRAGTATLTNSRGIREPRRLRLDASHDSVSEPHAAKSDASNLLIQLTTDLQRDIHSINESIATIDDLVRRDGRPTEQRALENCRRRVQRITRWTQSVVDSNLIRQGKVQTIYRWENILSWLTDEQCRWSQWAVSANMEIDFKLHVDAMSRIWTDPNIVHRIMENLIANAIEASHPDQRIQIAAELTQDEEPWLVISVIDSSAFRAKADAIQSPHMSDLPDGLCPIRGYGLGLSVCMQLARMLDGYLDYSSLPGRGTRFDLHLPAGGIFAWLRRQGRRVPAKMVASPLYLIEAEWKTGKLNPSVQAIVNDTLQRSLHRDAEVIQFDDTRWLAFARHTHINKNQFETRINHKLNDLDAANHDKPYGIRFRLQDIASITHILDCVQQASGTNSVEVDKAHGRVSMPHFELAQQRRTDRVKSTSNPESELAPTAPVASQLNKAAFRRIDAKHAMPRRSRLSFRAIQLMAKDGQEFVK